MRYAKFTDGILCPAVDVFVPGENFIFKPTEEQLLMAGFLPMRKTQAPKVANGQSLSFRWVQTDDAIVQEWEVCDKKPTVYEVARSMVIQTADDNTALRMRSLYPEWEVGKSYEAGHKVRHGGKLWRVIQPHTSQDGWQPENAASLWEQINETHDGTLYDAIPYEGNMALESGKHYTQDGVVYRCIRDTGNPVHHALAELVGLYVEAV